MLLLGEITRNYGVTWFHNISLTELVTYLFYFIFRLIARLITNCESLTKIQPRPQSSPVSFDVKSAVKLVGRTRLGRLAINSKSKMAERGHLSNFSQENGNHISLPPSTTILKRSGVMHVTYTSEIFPDPRSKKQGFRREISGTFSR